MLKLTFSMIKPDAVKRNLVQEIQNHLTQEELEIVLQKRIHLTTEQAKNFYSEHEGKSFFEDMIKNICAGEVIVQILRGEDAIIKNRHIMGATNPKNADQGTLRQKYGIDIDFNSIHGSDSDDSAEKEMHAFFSEEEIEQFRKT